MYLYTKRNMKNILYSNFYKFFNFISNLVFPVMCILCKKDGVYLCGECENKLELSKDKINAWIYSKYKYKNKKLKKIEYAIKYNHHPELGVTLGEHSFEIIFNNIISKIKIEDKTQDIFLVPIPISKERLKQRGYNQTKYIADGILKRSKNKMNTKIKIVTILSRKETSKLKDIFGIENRLEEMRCTMSVRDDFKINRNSIFILIDDITTTGATFYEARRALVEYGIIEKNIYAYSLAH